MVRRGAGAERIDAQRGWPIDWSSRAANRLIRAVGWSGSARSAAGEQAGQAVVALISLTRPWRAL